MRHEHDRKPQPGAQAGQQPHDLRLRGHVQRARHLVAQQHGGPRRERAGNGHALALSAAELRRAPVGQFLRNADLPQQLRNARSRVRLSAEQAQRLIQRLAHGPAWVERGGGVLKHKLHPAADVAGRGMRHIPPIEQKLARIEMLQTRNLPQQRALAAAALADDAENFPRLQREAHVVQRADTFVFLCGVPDFQQRFVFHHTLPVQQAKWRAPTCRIV